MAMRWLATWLVVLSAAIGGGIEAACAQDFALASQRQFSPYEVWGEQRADPQMQAAAAIAQLPSPQQTTGIRWQVPDPSATVPRMSVPEYEVPLRDPLPELAAHFFDADLVAPPLEGPSWQCHSWFAGAFVGGAVQGDLTASDPLMGLRLGWDLDQHYGIEGRYAFSSPQLLDAGGSSLGESHGHLLDVSALYYPLGDSRWRPYFGLGIGLATHRFRDERKGRADHAALTMPISAGVKYLYSPHFTLRLDAVETITFGSSNLGGTNNLSFLGSIEYRFGGRRTQSLRPQSFRPQ